MGYHENIDRIWKSWDLVDKKVREIASVTFDKSFNNKSIKKLLNSLADNLNQELNTQVADTNTDSGSNKSEPSLPQKKPPISNIISPLSSAFSSPL